jgi:hypothetical protein
MFKAILRRQFRRKLLDPSLVDIVPPTQWKALMQILRPRFRSYVTPEMVEKALAAMDQEKKSRV